MSKPPATSDQDALRALLERHPRATPSKVARIVSRFPGPLPAGLVDSLSGYLGHPEWLSGPFPSLDAFRLLATRILRVDRELLAVRRRCVHPSGE